VPERAVLATCERHGLAFLPYFPLMHGLLTGKYRRNEPPPAGTRVAKMSHERQAAVASEHNMERVEALDGWARDNGHTLLELAFSWLLVRPAVASIIAGATKPEQVRANASAAGWQLEAADMDEVDQVLAGA
jgi:aryl-alcohol dehydrogenase-like predicted oxidoreductase